MSDDVERPTHLTSHQLAALLLAQPDMHIEADGCDCANPVTGVRIEPCYGKDAVWIEVDA